MAAAGRKGNARRGRDVLKAKVVRKGRDVRRDKVARKVRDGRRAKAVRRVRDPVPVVDEVVLLPVATIARKGKELVRVADGAALRRVARIIGLSLAIRLPCWRR